ncbi:hypothetical protein [Peribacillus sp. SCS-155]|uniref:hypothetical protein n=1 Tax=Peribacillus sedimenti TaxID=3115297 RepID=UPI003905EC1F
MRTIKILLCMMLVTVFPVVITLSFFNHTILSDSIKVGVIVFLFYCWLFSISPLFASDSRRVIYSVGCFLIVGLTLEWFGHSGMYSMLMGVLVSSILYALDFIIQDKMALFHKMIRNK